MNKDLDAALGLSPPVEKDVPRASDTIDDFSMSIPASWPVGWWQQGLNAPDHHRTSIVGACVDAYAQTIASVAPFHWRYSDDDTKVKVRTSSQSRLMFRPNSYQTRSDFNLNLSASLLYHGNAYIFGVRNDRHEFASLHLLHPKMTDPYVEPDSREIFYSVSDTPLIPGINPEMMIPASEICHIRLFTPRHPLRGVSPIMNAAYAIAANKSISKQQAEFFGNMSRPSGILSSELKFTKDQMKQLRDAFNEQAKSLNTGGIPILGSGIKWQPMSITSQDAQLVEAFAMTVEDIARAFRVPLPLVNDNRHSTYNNVEQLISHWLSGGLGFMIDHIENNLDAFFGFTPTDRIEFDVDLLLRTDFMTRIEGYTKAIQSALMSPDEARSKFGGLPKVAHGHKPLVQQQMVPLGWMEQQAKLEASKPPAPPPEPEIDEEEARGAAVYFLKKAMNDG